MSGPDARLCAAAQAKELAHCAPGFKNRFGADCEPAVRAEWREHYLFLHAVQADCLECVCFWINRGADLQKGTINNPAWNACEWAKTGRADRVGKYLETLSGSVSKGLETLEGPSEAPVYVSRWGRARQLPETSVAPAEKEACLTKTEDKVCFSDSDDSELWYTAMRGDRALLETMEDAPRCLQLRPEYGFALPDALWSWSLREFLKLRDLFQSKYGHKISDQMIQTDKSRTSNKMRQKKVDVQPVLAWLQTMEEETVMLMVKKMQGDMFVVKKESMDLLGLLWTGRVHGHGTSSSEMGTRELWRKVFSTMTVSDLQQILQEKDVRSRLFDTAWDVNISHTRSTRHWTIRLHCYAAHLCSKESRLRQMWTLLCEAEEVCIAEVAKDLAEGKNYSQSEMEAFFRLLDFNVDV